MALKFTASSSVQPAYSSGSQMPFSLSSKPTKQAPSQSVNKELEYVQDSRSAISALGSKLQAESSVHPAQESQSQRERSEHPALGSKLQALGFIQPGTLDPPHTPHASKDKHEALSSVACSSKLQAAASMHPGISNSSQTPSPSVSLRQFPEQS